MIAKNVTKLFLTWKTCEHIFNDFTVIKKTDNLNCFY